jgi:predicted Zn-dependent protease
MSEFVRKSIRRLARWVVRQFMPTLVTTALVLALLAHDNAGATWAFTPSDNASSQPLNEKPSADTAAAKRKMLDEVFQRLLSAAGRRPGRFASKYVWPPQVELDSNSTVNAYASVRRKKVRGRDVPIVDPKTNRLFPYVAIHSGLMEDLIEGDPHRLAFVVGHELAHLILGHVLKSTTTRAKTQTIATVLSAEQEHEADILGMKLALSAGYSIRGVREVWLRIMSEDFLRRQPHWRNYTSFEGQGISHPAWTDRLALIDKEKQELWRSMSAFENGVFFLGVQQYAAAEESFSRVIENGAFPESYDAWANLGYAQLMQYADKLDANNVAQFDIGQLITGSFYARPKTLEQQVRGIDIALWNKAVYSLNMAVELNPSGALAKANLGVAYLIAPTGRDADKAAHFLEQAAELDAADAALTAAGRGAMLNNAAVALAAAGAMTKAEARLGEAVAVLRNQEWAATAVTYNRARFLSKSSDPSALTKALSLLSDYLLAESPASLWWDRAYELYAQLSPNPKPRAEFLLHNRSMSNLRPVTSVEVSTNVRINLSDEVSEVTHKLGAVRPVPVVAGANLKRLSYPGRGMELLVTRRVVAIFLRGGMLELKIQAAGLGARAAVLRLGMSAAQVQGALGSAYMAAPLSDPNVFYKFYPGVGVAIRYDAADRVTELVVTKIMVAE